MKPSNHRLVVRRRPSGAPLTASRFHVEVSFLIDHCLSSTIQTIHVPILAKAVGFTIEEFSIKNKKVYTLL
jgi:hypothetical protein